MEATVGAEHVICNGVTTDTEGNPPIAVTDVVSITEHPLVALVAVTV